MRSKGGVFKRCRRKITLTSLYNPLSSPTPDGIMTTLRLCYWTFGMSIHNKKGIRYRFPVMVARDNRRSSHRGVMDSGDQWWINTRPLAFESYSNTRQFQSLMVVFIKSTWHWKPPPLRLCRHGLACTVARGLETIGQKEELQMYMFQVSTLRCS